jgi:hypothetical protein
MASETSFSGEDRDRYFNVFDPTNGKFAIYWLAPDSRPTTVVKPNATFHCPSRNFSTKAPHAVNDLTSPASYTSREDEEGRLTSTLVLFLRSGAVQCSMPHHLIGPNGLLSQAKGPTAGVSTGIGGTFRFVKLTEGFHEG